DSILERWFTAEFRATQSTELAGMRAMLTRTPKQGYLAACGALKRADLRPYAGRIEAPTLCLVGDQDGSTPVSLVKETAALIPPLGIEVIGGGGYLPNWEKTKIVTGFAPGPRRGGNPWRGKFLGRRWSMAQNQVAKI